MLYFADFAGGVLRVYGQRGQGLWSNKGAFLGV